LFDKLPIRRRAGDGELRSRAVTSLHLCTPGFQHRRRSVAPREISTLSAKCQQSVCFSHSSWPVELQVAEARKAQDHLEIEQPTYSSRLITDHFSGPGGAIRRVCVCLCVRAITAELSDL